MRVGIPFQTKEAVVSELESLRAKHGVLRAEDVVAYAENPSTALHKEFEWDNDLAAHAYRIVQAEKLIRCSVEMIKGHPQRVFVSLRADRGEEGFYRSTREVLAKADLRNAWIGQALDEAESWQRRYEDIEELAAVFGEISKARRSHEKKRKR